MRKILVWLGLFACLLAWPAAAQAWSNEDWQVIGAVDQAWLFSGETITGLAEEPSRRGFLVTDPTRVTIDPDFIFRFSFTPLQGVDHNFVWNFHDERNYYQAHFYGSGVGISRFIDGQLMLSISAPVTINLDQIYQIELSQQGAHLTLKVDGASKVEFDDWLHDEQSQGSVGFKLAPGTIFPVESRFAEIKWENLPLVETTESEVGEESLNSLSVGLLKQTDPSWGELEYDLASSWSDQPTIGRWGCALTSFVMIMRYYGLTTMPDGQPATPATVNAWLNSQPDGYVGQSLVNWWAGLRLVREISNQYSTAENLLPKLEFAFSADNWQSVAREEILAERPVIVNVPGHFLVTDGLMENSEDFLIKDPFYDYELLSEHPSVESLRLFRPSQTNLSAIVVVHAPYVTVELANEASEVVGESWTENYSVPGESEATETWQFTVVNQPTGGEYQLKLSGMLDRADAQLFSYNQAGEVVSFRLPWNFSETENVTIEFDKENPSYFAPSFSWQRWWEELARLHDEEKLPTKIYDRLNDLAWRAEEQSVKVQQRYQFYSQQILEFYDEEINPAEYGYLRALISQNLRLALGE